MAKAREDGRPTAERHEGHDVTTTTAGHMYCRTCKRGEHDVDEIAVERAVAGEPPERLTTAEREAAVARLLLIGDGITLVEIAQRVGCHKTHVGRIRDRLGMPSARAKTTPPSGSRVMYTSPAPAVQEATDVR